MAITKFTKKEKQFSDIPGRHVGKFATPKRRRQLPASYFLEPKERKYPYRLANGQVSRRLLVAAIHRAAQYGNKTVEAKARRLLERYFGKEEERKKSKKVYAKKK